MTFYLFWLHGTVERTAGSHRGIVVRYRGQGNCRSFNSFIFRPWFLSILAEITQLLRALGEGKGDKLSIYLEGEFSLQISDITVISNHNHNHNHHQSPSALLLLPRSLSISTSALISIWLCRDVCALVYMYMYISLTKYIFN